MRWRALVCGVLLGVVPRPVCGQGLNSIGSIHMPAAEAGTGGAVDPLDTRPSLKPYPPGGPEADVHPLKGRVAVVLVHGYGKPYVNFTGFAGAFTWTGFLNAWKKSLPEGSGTEDGPAGPAKLYHYVYRPVRPYPEMAAELADHLVDELLTGPDAARQLVLVAHSAGTLMSRYAAADPRISPKVAGIFTLAGIHHGSVQASLVTAYGLEARPGMTPARLALLDELRGGLGLDPRVHSPDPATRIPCAADATCAVLESIAFDNFDGSISDEDQQRYGMMVNTSLAEFNRDDALASRVYAYHGEITDLGMEAPGRPLLGRIFGRRNQEPTEEAPQPTQEEAERRLLEALNPAWSTADPLVTYGSGFYQGSPEEVAARFGFKNVNHRDILWDHAVQEALVTDLHALLARMTPITVAETGFGPAGGAGGLFGFHP